MDSILFGRGFRALRIRRRLTQLDLAGRAGTSRGVIVRIERGGAADVTVQTLERVAAPLGALVVCRLSWNGEGLDRLLDSSHAAIVEQVVRILGPAGWLVATEVSFNHFGERGSIDILAFHPGTRLLLVIEVKSVVPDVQSSLVALDRKERLALEIARERGWNAVGVSRLLVIREDRTTRRRIEEHAATFANAFPDRARVVRGWLTRPDTARHGSADCGSCQTNPRRTLNNASAGRDAVRSVARARRVDMRALNGSVDKSAPHNVQVRFV